MLNTFIAQVKAQNYTHVTIPFRHILHLRWPSDLDAPSVFAVIPSFYIMHKLCNLNMSCLMRNYLVCSLFPMFSFLLLVPISMTLKVLGLGKNSFQYRFWYCRGTSPNPDRDIPGGWGYSAPLCGQAPLFLWLGEQDKHRSPRSLGMIDRTSCPFYSNWNSYEWKRKRVCMPSFVWIAARI